MHFHLYFSTLTKKGKIDTSECLLSGAQMKLLRNWRRERDNGRNERSGFTEDFHLIVSGSKFRDESSNESNGHRLPKSSCSIILNITLTEKHAHRQMHTECTRLNSLRSLSLFFFKIFFFLKIHKLALTDKAKICRRGNPWFARALGLYVSELLPFDKGCMSSAIPFHMEKTIRAKMLLYR